MADGPTLPQVYAFLFNGEQPDISTAAGRANFAWFKEILPDAIARAGLSTKKTGLNETGITAEEWGRLQSEDDSIYDPAFSQAFVDTFNDVADGVADAGAEPDPDPDLTTDANAQTTTPGGELTDEEKAADDFRKWAIGEDDPDDRRKAQFARFVTDRYGLGDQDIGEEMTAFLNDIRQKIEDRFSLQLDAGVLDYTTLLQEALPDNFGDLKEARATHAKLEADFDEEFVKVVDQLGMELTNEERDSIQEFLKTQFEEGEIISGQEIDPNQFIVDNINDAVDGLRVAQTEQLTRDTIEALRQSGQFDKASRLAGPPPGAGIGDAFRAGLADENIEDLTGLTDDERQQLTLDRVAAANEAIDLRIELEELEATNVGDQTDVDDLRKRVSDATKRADELFSREQVTDQQRRSQAAVAQITSETRGPTRFAASESTLDQLLNATVANQDFGDFVRGKFDTIRQGFVEAGAGRPFSEHITSELPGLRDQFNAQTEQREAQENRQRTGRRRAAAQNIQRPIGRRPSR